MDTKEILIEVGALCKQVFENPALDIVESTSPNDIKNWDSLNHVMLLSSIEKRFNVKFDLDNMLSFETIGDICKSVEEKIQP